MDFCISSKKLVDFRICSLKVGVFAYFNTPFHPPPPKSKLPVLNVPHLLSKNKAKNWSSLGSGPLGSGPIGPGSAYSVMPLGSTRNGFSRQQKSKFKVLARI